MRGGKPSNLHLIENNLKLLQAVFGNILILFNFKTDFGLVEDRYKTWAGLSLDIKLGLVWAELVIFALRVNWHKSTGQGANRLWLHLLKL